MVGTCICVRYCSSTSPGARATSTHRRDRGEATPEADLTPIADGEKSRAEEDGESCRRTAGEVAPPRDERLMGQCFARRVSKVKRSCCIVVGVPCESGARLACRLVPGASRAYLGRISGASRAHLGRISGASRLRERLRLHKEQHAVRDEELLERQSADERRDAAEHTSAHNVEEVISDRGHLRDWAARGGHLSAAARSV